LVAIDRSERQGKNSEMLTSKSNGPTICSPDGLSLVFRAMVMPPALTTQHQGIPASASFCCC
jgi:hypothetical protein